jgi:PAT family beta-lactamase induction signal transducer AmpG
MIALPALNDSARLRYGTFFYLYFMQGIPSGFALTALTNYLLANGISSSGIGTFISIVGFPWIIQFLWGPFIDRYQFSLIGHRKHWVLLTQLAALIASFSLLFVTDPVTQVPLLTLVFFIHSLFASVQDASVDAMAISVVPDAERSRVNAFMRGGLLLGISFGAAVLSYLLHRFGFRTAVLTQSSMLFFFTVITSLIKLDRTDPLLPQFRAHDHHNITATIPVRQLFKHLWASMSQRNSLSKFAIILMLYFSFSVFVSAFSFHMIKVLRYPDQELSILQGGWGSLAVFTVVLIGGIVADRVGPAKLQVKVMWVLAAFLILFNAFASFWKVKWIAVGGLLVWNLADPLFSVAAFPILMALCKAPVEGSQFTTYMALINFAGILGAFITGWALHVVPAPLLGMGCGVIILVCIYFTVGDRRSAMAPIDAPGSS